VTPLFDHIFAAVCLSIAFHRRRRETKHVLVKKAQLKAEKIKTELKSSSALKIFHKCRCKIFIDTHKAQIGFLK
jgi:hypothetical protein